MKRTQLRSDCPINYSLEILGDPWSLLILRDIIYFGKHTFNEFLRSDEKIARNILAERLNRLQEQGLVIKASDTTDQRKMVYSLTEDGLEIIPVLLDLADWGAQRLQSPNMPRGWLQLIRTERTAVLPLIRQVVAGGGSIFGGELLPLLQEKRLL